mgnify:CR=1 FL=1
MNFVGKVWKVLVGIKDGLVLIFMLLFFMVLFSALTCGLGVLISALMVAFTERKQALHDMICDTVVVDKWAYTENEHLQQPALGTVTIVVLVVSGLVTVAAIGVGIAMIGVIASSMS